MSVNIQFRFDVVQENYDTGTRVYACPSCRSSVGAAEGTGIQCLDCNEEMGEATYNSTDQRFEW